MNKIGETDIMSVCSSLPETAATLETINIIQRENVIDTLERMLSGGDTSIVTIEAEEGMGKTTLLIQFAKEHRSNTICLFIKPTNRWGYDPEVLRFDLCNQINFVLEGNELALEDVDDNCLRSIVFKLARRARSNGEIYYFVVDGLDEIPEENLNMRESIIDMLPFGLTNFRFIITGDLSRIFGNKMKGIIAKPFPISGFTLEETNSYFSDLNISKEYIREIYLNCKKIPGRLASVKRILHSGMSIEEFMTNKTEQWDDLFEIEWRKTANTKLQNEILAILAIDKKQHTSDEISQLLNVEIEMIEESIYGLSFINYEKDSNKIIRFVTEGFRRFARNKLKELNKFVNELFVDFLLKQPTSDDSLMYLPSYLESAGKYDILINYLSAEHFQEMLRRSQSLAVVEQKMDLGIKTSQKLHRDEELMRFCIQKSIMKELEDSQVWRSEVEARMAMDDFDSAIALAQTTIIKEDRLHLFAIICKKRREKNLIVEPELIDQIKALYSDIGGSMSQEKCIEVASDLIFTCPDIAIDMVEKTNTNSTGENDIDIAFAQLTMATIEKGENNEHQQALERINSKIKDPSLRNLTNSANILMGEYSASQVIKEIEKFENATNKLFLLRRWTITNKERDDAYIVLEYALNLTIITTAYAPNAKVLRELSTPLPYIKDKEKCLQLIKSLDSQKGTIEKLGPTEDYIGLQLILAHAESKYEFEAATNRMVELYLYIDEIDDLNVSASCLSQLYAKLELIDPEGLIEKSDNLHSLSKKDLMEKVDKLLITTADHYQVVKGIIKSLAKYRPEVAYELALKLNTEERRDSALHRLITASLNTNYERIDFNFLNNIIEKVRNPREKSRSIIDILERLNDETKNADGAISVALTLIPKIKTIKVAENFCQSSSLLFSILCKDLSGKFDNLKEQIMCEIVTTWESIDSGWNKINIGYYLVADISKVSNIDAKQLIERIDNYKEQIMIDSHSTANTFIWTLRLATRAYSGLLPKQFNTDFDLERLNNLIDQIPSYGERAEIWADLALRCYNNKQKDKCTSIVSEHVKSLLSYISITDSQYWNDLIISLAPALYCGHSLTAFEMIDKLHPSLRDYAYIGICKFILTKQLPIDPYDGSNGNGYEISYEEIINICEILSKMESDSLIYMTISAISETIHYKRNRYTLQQQTDISNRLMEIIEQKLPDIRNITHDGYKIISKAEVARIKRSSSAEWIAIIDEARKIENYADRSYILCIIATLLPGRESIRQSQLLQESKKIIDELPSIFDRISHYELFASTAWGVTHLSRECLHTAMREATKNDNPEFFKVQRRLIDLAHRMDPDLAASLASIGDDDEARSEVRFNLKQQMKINEIKKNMCDNKEINNKQEIEDINYCKAAWKLLGSLNARKIESINFNETLKYFEIISRVPMTKAYPMLAWIIENSVKRCSTTEQAQAIIRPIFESVLLGAELALRMAERSSSIIKNIKFGCCVEDSKQGLVVHPGERDLAIEYLKNWFEYEAGDYIKFNDPFFCLEDLEVLRIIKSVNPKCFVQIITSKKQQMQEGVKTPWEKEYKTHWNLRVSQQTPPDTEILILGTESQGENPIHDRWLVGQKDALRIGTSFNSIGITKTSEISKVTENEKEILENEIDQYLTRRKREFNGERLQYVLFTL